jgi:hypothetical protein
MTLRRRAGQARRWRPATLALVAAAATLIGCRGAPDERDATLGRMHAACVSAMVASACQVMGGPTPGSSSAATDAAPSVVIAGVGRIDAQAYRALRESGDAMCGVARAACEREWDGASCRGARALWSTQTVASR